MRYTEFVPPSEVLSPDAARDAVIAYNLRMLEGNDLRYLLGMESTGGIGGSVVIDGNTFRCSGINGYADDSDGLIIAFGNSIQRDNPVVAQCFAGFILRVAYLWTDHTNRLIGIHSDQLGDEAVGRIGAAALRYNARQIADTSR